LTIFSTSRQAFGILKFNKFIRLSPGTTLLNKQGRVADHRYLDHWIDDHTFHWQSQNSASPTSKRGREIIEHQNLGMSIHLFVREARLAGGTAARFVYFGPVMYRSHSGSEPMSVVFDVLC
jgi:hypothetical protein